MSPHWCSFHLLMSIVFLEISDVTGGVQRQVMFLRGQYWDQHCSTLSVTWTMGLRAPSESLPVTPSFWSSFSTHWRDGMLSTEASAGQRGGYMWTSWTSMWPSTRSCTWVRTTQSANTGWAENGLRAALEKTSESWSTRSSTRHAIIQQSWARKPDVSWAASKLAWEEGWVRWFCLWILFLWDLTQRAAYSSEVLNIEWRWTCWSEPRGGHADDQRAEATLLWRCAGRVGFFSLEKRSSWGDSTSQNLKGAYRKDRERLLTRACRDR